jgi:hypothetical protein
MARIKKLPLKKRKRLPDGASRSGAIKRTKGE